MNIINGPIPRAQRITIYGPPAIGKTTLAARFPDVILIDTEDGSTHLDLRRITVKDYPSLCEALRALRDIDTPCQTVAVDTIDYVELFLRDEVCRQHKIDGIEGLGYGKGWVYLTEKFTEFVSRYFDPLISKGIHVVVVGHASPKRITYPGMDAFDRWELRLYSGCANRLKEWSDAVLFLNWKTRVTIENGKPKGLGGTERAIYTTHSAAHDAKTRIALPEVVPCDFSAIGRLLCDWQRPPRVSVQEQFASALASIDQQQLIAFLISRGQIKDDQEITDVTAEYAKEALRRIEEFKKTVSDFDFLR